MAKSVRVVFLGGVGEIGKNMTAIEYDNDMFIVDCGIDFPDEQAPGIDAIIPDITYLEENKDKLRGIILTHGHEDHIGAIPYIIEELDCPIYGTALTLGMVERKLIERKIDAELVTVDAGESIKLGRFNIEFIKVCHSMAGACAFSITSPCGTIFITGDYKIDSTPIDGKRTDLQRIAEIGAKGVTLMLGESTNVEKQGHSVSEKAVGIGLDNIFASHRDKRMIIATFASSNYRVQQILNLAHKYGRKVLLSGRSMKGIVEVASKVGELKVPKNCLVENFGNIPMSRQLVLATGTQGEPMSALTRMSDGNFNNISIGEKDVVVLSSSPIPGNEKSVYGVINKLFKKGAEVIYESMNDVHVSGHAYAEELKVMLSLVRPKFFIPVHGEYRHQFLHAKIAEDMGVHPLNIAIPEIGMVYGVNKRSLKRQSNVPAGNSYVDGIILDEGNNIIRDRKNLAENGFLIVILNVDYKNGVLMSKPDILVRGMTISDEFRNKAEYLIERAISNLDFEKTVVDRSMLTQTVRKTLKKQFIKDRHYPMIMPIIIES